MGCELCLCAWLRMGNGKVVFRRAEEGTGVGKVAPGELR